MRTIFLLAGISFIALETSAQAPLPPEQIAFRKDLLHRYQNLHATPEDHERLVKMKALPFFPFDSAFRVAAVLDTTGTSSFEGMKTSHGPDALYRTYGYLHFTLAGRAFRMPVYQGNAELAAGRDQLFFPFTDKTNGETTYHGGRYIDLPIPKATTLWVDFNRAYNPYCAYSQRYSCEIPPRENHFPIRIEAGLKY